MLRKQAHAEAILLLATAAEAIDQAHAYLKDAKTADAVETGSGPPPYQMRRPRSLRIAWRPASRCG